MLQPLYYQTLYIQQSTYSLVHSGVVGRYTMKSLILITILCIAQVSYGTLDIKKLHQNAAIKLQTLKDQASTGLHQFAESIDLDKLKQIDFLNLIPRLQDRLHQNGPSHLTKIKFYLQSLKSLNGQDLVLAFDGDAPWPSLRRIDEDEVEYA